MYGFQGRFALRRATWANQQLAFKADVPATTIVVPMHKRFSYAVRDSVRWLRGKRVANSASHGLIYFLWEFEAVKPTTREA